MIEIRALCREDMLAIKDHRSMQLNIPTTKYAPFDLDACKKALLDAPNDLVADSAYCVAFSAVVACCELLLSSRNAIIFESSNGVLCVAPLQSYSEKIWVCRRDQLKFDVEGIPFSSIMEQVKRRITAAAPLAERE